MNALYTPIDCYTQSGNCIFPVLGDGVQTMALP